MKQQVSGYLGINAGDQSERAKKTDQEFSRINMQALPAMTSRDLSLMNSINAMVPRVGSMGIKSDSLESMNDSVERQSRQIPI